MTIQKSPFHILNTAWSMLRSKIHEREIINEWRKDYVKENTHKNNSKWENEIHSILQYNPEKVLDLNHLDLFEVSDILENTRYASSLLKNAYFMEKLNIQIGRELSSRSPSHFMLLRSLMHHLPRDMAKDIIYRTIRTLNADSKSNNRLPATHNRSHPHISTIMLWCNILKIEHEDIVCLEKPAVFNTVCVICIHLLNAHKLNYPVDIFQNITRKELCKRYLDVWLYGLSNTTSNDVLLKSPYKQQQQRFQKLYSELTIEDQVACKSMFECVYAFSGMEPYTYSKIGTYPPTIQKAWYLGRAREARENKNPLNIDFNIFSPHVRIDIGLNESNYQHLKIQDIDALLQEIKNLEALEKTQMVEEIDLEIIYDVT